MIKTKTTVGELEKLFSILVKNTPIYIKNHHYELVPVTSIEVDQIKGIAVLVLKEGV